MMKQERPDATDSYGEQTKNHEETKQCQPAIG